MSQPLPAVKKAETAIRYFEERGRKVSAVTIRGAEITLAFAGEAEKAVPVVDLVDMSK